MDKWFEKRRKKERATKPLLLAAAGSVPFSATGPSTGTPDLAAAAMPTPDSASAMEVDPELPPTQRGSGAHPPAAEGRPTGGASPTDDVGAAECSDIPAAEGRFVEPRGAASDAKAAPCPPSAAGTPQTAPATCSGAPSSVAHDVIDISPDVIDASRDVIDLSIDEGTPAPAAPRASAGAHLNPNSLKNRLLMLAASPELHWPDYAGIAA